MGKYIVTSGQNIYDVALHIYGSIEGIVDLMMNNSSLSFCNILKTGDELQYTDDFIINNDIVSYYRMNSIVPANGERNVYFKTPSYPILFEVYVDKNNTMTGLILSGEGILEVDWGDNTPIKTITLSSEKQAVTHFFDNNIPDDRRIRFYGKATFNLIDFGKLSAKSIFFIQPVYIEKVVLEESSIDIDFLHLVDGVYQIKLNKFKTNNLLPLLACKELKELDLSGGFFDQIVLDNYLISLVNQHNGRRNCSIVLTMHPSGMYKEPSRDSHNNYIVSTGMEAVWLLINEPSWNEGGSWKFTINHEVYCNQ